MEELVAIRLSNVDSGPSNLTVTYTVLNGSPEPIYIVNRLFRRGRDGFTVDPDVVYSHRNDKGLVHFKKCLVEVPDDLDVEAPEVPYLTQVGAKSEFSETINVRLPAVPRDPYRPQPTLDRVQEAEGFILELGYVIPSNGSGQQRIEVAGGGMEWYLDYSTLHRLQRLWASAPTQLAVATTIARG